MRLYLVQHGWAKSKEEDPERGLNDHGRQDVEHMADFLKGSGVKVNRVIHSGKLRAQQTAEVLAEAIMSEPRLEVTDMIGPNDAPTPFAYEIRELTTDTMVVGHLPFMARMISHLVLGDADRMITSYQPGTVVCLERSEEGLWAIAWMVRPELI